VGAHIMLVSPHPEELQGFAHNGRLGPYIIQLPGVKQASQWFLVLPLSQNAIQIKGGGHANDGQIHSGKSPGTGR
jgi:hypothetical protein